MAADVLNNLEWLARAYVYEAVLRLARYCLALIEDYVGGVGDGAWLYQLAPRGLFEVSACALLGLGELLPCCEHLIVDAE